MDSATNKVYRDLSRCKHWHEVTVCHNKELNVSYIIAQETEDSLKFIVYACDLQDEIAHFELQSLFNSLSPPGDMETFEHGILLAIVGSSSTVVYHRMMQGVFNVLPMARKKK